MRLYCKFKRKTGVGPATSTLARWRSTTELFPQKMYKKDTIKNIFRQYSFKEKSKKIIFFMHLNKVCNKALFLNFSPKKFSEFFWAIAGLFFENILKIIAVGKSTFQGCLRYVYFGVGKHFYGLLNSYIC